MKRHIINLLLIFLLFSISPAARADAGAPAAPAVSEYESVGAMWELVSEYSPSDFVTAGIVTQIWFESGCIANAVGGGYLIGPDYDETVTAEIDAGLADGSTRDAFTKHVINKHQCWGYGLIQWVTAEELGKLYDFAQQSGTSIGDADMQVRFILWNTEENFPEVWEKLLACESAGDAGVIFGHWIGGTDDGLKLSDRAWLAEELYKEYGNE